MNAKVGQYVRRENRFYEVKEPKQHSLDFEITCRHLFEDFNRVFHIDKINKVGNTPQELIEVGDLAEVEDLEIDFCSFDNNKTVVKIQHTDNEYYLGFGADNDINFAQVTKILTPNLNGGYDLQWESE